VLVRKLQDVSIQVKTASTWFGVTTLALVWVISSGISLPDTSWYTIGYAALLGGVGIVLMTLTVLYGVTHMPISRSAVILLFEVVAGAVSSQLLSNEVIQLVEWIGGGVIIWAAYLSTRSHLNEQKIQN